MKKTIIGALLIAAAIGAHAEQKEKPVGYLNGPMGTTYLYARKCPTTNVANPKEWRVAVLATRAQMVKTVSLCYRNIDDAPTDFHGFEVCPAYYEAGSKGASVDHNPRQCAYASRIFMRKYTGN